MSGLDHLDYEDVESLAEVHRLVSKEIKLCGGSIPAVGTPAWWSAPLAAKVASLLVLAEARLLDDPHQLAAEQLRDVSKAISGALDWREFTGPTGTSRAPSCNALGGHQHRKRPEMGGGR